uniref:Uncharacterized protein n=1 Tax=Zooxanthella nutricula TaxID=1333877 RepID=A0A7S2VT94_9DINO
MLRVAAVALAWLVARCHGRSSRSGGRGARVLDAGAHAGGADVRAAGEARSGRQQGLAHRTAGGCTTLSPPLFEITEGVEESGLFWQESGLFEQKPEPHSGEDGDEIASWFITTQPAYRDRFRAYGPTKQFLFRGLLELLAEGRYLREIQRESPKLLFNPNVPTTLSSKVGKQVRLAAHRLNALHRRYGRACVEKPDSFKEEAFRVLVTDDFPPGAIDEAIELYDKAIRSESGSHSWARRLGHA